jgi:type IV secretion system protein VirB2
LANLNACPHYPEAESLGIGRQMLPCTIRAWSAITAASAILVSSAANAQDSYSDPAGSGVLVSALSWLQGTLLGTIATVAAVIAVATVGFMMLTGRINWRYGVTVILGCFVLFGASSIVAGIQSTATLGQ